MFSLLKYAVQTVVLSIGTVVTLILGFGGVLSYSLIGGWCILPVALGVMAAGATAYLFDSAGTFFGE